MTLEKLNLLKVDFEAIGIKGKVKVLWSQKELGPFEKSFSGKKIQKEVGLFRLTTNK